MRFGAIPLDQAEGSFLAHAVRAGDVTFKKGRVLTSDDLATLECEGIKTVMACRLDANDIAEDEAATKIAAAIRGSHIKADQAFTGRVNLRAAEDGVLALDTDRINRLNQVDASITLATLPNLASVSKEQMLATVKIIPFAVRQDHLDLVVDIAREAISPDGRALISVAPFKPKETVLIQTRLPGTKETVLDKTVTITAERLSVLNGRLIGEVRCAHDVEQLADRLKMVQGDLVLIAGASAITDRRDVLPSAIEQAGGVIEHFGMPVDPGNLLLLGRLGTRPVVGLPGCARSPKLNGFDWVLQRLFAGIDIGATDIMAMGVGGLLTEIPSRPQPRDRQQKMKDNRIVAVLLAAGRSTRMGRSNKLLANVDGQAMVLHAVDAMLGAKIDHVIVVTGHEAPRIRDAIGPLPVTFVHNPDYAQGLSTSLKVGLGALPGDESGVVIGLGDMPRIRSSDINRLIAAFNPDEGRSICVPTVHGKRGNPVLFSVEFVEEMLGIEGDVGAKHLIGAHADQVVEIEMDDESTLIDVDTKEALAALAR